MAPAWEGTARAPGMQGREWIVNTKSEWDTTIAVATKWAADMVHMEVGNVHMPTAWSESEVWSRSPPSRR